jgi:UDP-4-amino-4,6-dideoxy-N-acetyl-beta-L-altrosamine transaminase
MNFPYSRQDITKRDISDVNKVLRSDIITQGNIVVEFERKIKSFVGSKYGFAIQNASCGLILACKSIGLKTGDIAWTTPNSFVATANCILHCNANIDFVDIDLNTYNISTEKLEEKLEKARIKNKLPKLLITVHLGGLPTDQEKIYKLSKKYNFKIIEDASHSLGAVNYGEKVGSCKWSDITIFSFHPVKIITTGEGGFLTTNNKKYAKMIGMLRNNGITREKKFLKNKILFNLYYEQHYLGYNFRMSEIQAALGLSQLKRLKNIIKKRNSLANNYKKLINIQNNKLVFQEIDKMKISSYHLFIVLVKNNFEVIKNLRKYKIYCNVHYKPIHLQPFYKKLGFKKGDFPNSEYYGDHAISIPIYFKLNFKNQYDIIKKIITT